MTHLLMVDGAVGIGTAVVEFVVVVVVVVVVVAVVGDVGVGVTWLVPLFLYLLKLWGCPPKMCVCLKCRKQSYDGIHYIF